MSLDTAVLIGIDRDDHRIRALLTPGRGNPSSPETRTT
jgi:hypothetical protein